jgi:hypothetical protein
MSKEGAERRRHRRFSIVEGMIEPITLELVGVDDAAKKQPAILTDLSAVGLSFEKITKDAVKRIEKMADDSADCQTRTALGLPDACGDDCPFHSLFTSPSKHSKKK